MEAENKQEENSQQNTETQQQEQQEQQQIQNNNNNQQENENKESPQENNNVNNNDQNNNDKNENVKEETVTHKKGCLISQHQNKETLFICTSLNCNKTVSRMICLDCIQDPLYAHQHPEYLLKYQEILNSKSFQIKHWPLNAKINKIYETVNAEIEDQLKDLDEFFENLQNQLLESLNETKKVIKQKLLNQKSSMSSTFSEIKKQITKTFDLTELKEQIEKFENDEINQTKLNDFLQKFSQQEIYRNEQQNIIIDLFENSQTRKESLEINPKTIPNIQSQVLKIVKDLIIKPYTFEFAPLIKGKSLGFGLYQGLPNQANIFVSQQSFKREQIVNFKFQMYSCPDLQYQFYMGIAKKGVPLNSVFWFNSGNQISLTHDNNSRKPFQSKGEKSLMRQVFYEGQQYQMDVCVSNNQLDIYDKERYVLFENLHDFEDGDDWVIVFGKFGDFILRVL